MRSSRGRELTPQALVEAIVQRVRAFGDQQIHSAAWSPLREPVFRALWIATIASNIGTWMQDIGAAWLMTSLTPSPFMVALVQVADNVPMFLLAIMAGALADVLDRRRLLLVAQAWMLVAAATLAVLTLTGVITPWLLVALVFALGLGAALSTPTWQAITPELIKGAQLPAAIALSGVAINVARAVGPAVGGAVVAAVGPGFAFLLNAASFVGVIIVIHRWRRRQQRSRMPAEHLVGAMQSGIRYVRYSPPLRAVLVRTGSFAVGASALWALLPLVARRQLGVDAAGYGLLLGCLGVGAVVGAAVLPAIRPKIQVDSLVAGATGLFALSTLALAYLRNLSLLYLALFAGGIAWIALMSSFNVAAQIAVPEWVRARGLAVYILAFQGGMALGGLLWGTVAASTSVPSALLFAAVFLAAGILETKRYALPSGDELDLSPAMHWPVPLVFGTISPEGGPVLVTVEYRIDPARARDFWQAMQAERLARLRYGAMRWHLFRDAANPGRYLETFLVQSWVEHLRQHERVTEADREVEDRARAFHIGDTPPVVTHLVAESGD